MSPLTDRLMSMDKSLVLHSEGEWNHNVSNYTSWNSGGVECEVGEFLYGLIRMVKPKDVLETGTHFGIGASYMGMALKDNFSGHLDTLEYLPENQAQAEIRMKIMGLTDYVTCHLVDAAEYNPDKTYQIILLDTEPELRFGEFLRFYNKLDFGGYIFIHDLGRHLQQIEIPNLGFAWPFGKLPEEMKNMMKDGQVRPFHFTTPRGFSGFYKVSSEDYSWL